MVECFPEQSRWGLGSSGLLTSESKALLSSLKDWILCYIKTYFTFLIRPQNQFIDMSDFRTSVSINLPLFLPESICDILHFIHSHVSIFYEPD